MLLSKQMSKASDRSQAQERLLVKVVQQNQEASKILKRVEKAVNGISEGLKQSFSQLRQELTAHSEEGISGLAEVKELWEKKIVELEKAVSSGGTESTKQIEKQMKKLEAMLTAKLLDLDVGSDQIKEELKSLRRDLIETNESRLRGEATAEGKMSLLLEEMKGLQRQLDRVEQLTLRIFNSLESGFTDIRKELLEGGSDANREGLEELKQLWLKKMSDLEKTLLSTGGGGGGGAGSGIGERELEKQMKKIEAMMNAKLLDLEINMTSLSPQLSEMKRVLGEVLGGMRRGEEEGEKRMREVMSELKGLQTQLIEVIRLQAETSQNLNAVSLSLTLSHTLPSDTALLCACLGSGNAQELYRQCEHSNLPHHLHLAAYPQTES
jgi:hypothetical protein